jgi:hypothetical protein
MDEVRKCLRSAKPPSEFRHPLDNAAGKFSAEKLRSQGLGISKDSFVRPEHSGD